MRTTEPGKVRHPSESTRVDILVHSYNHEDTIVQCLTSILAQSHPNLFVTVVDDSSSDSTWQRITQTQQRFPGRVTAKTTPQRLGIGEGFIEGREYFKPLGNFWGMIDGDDWWVDEDKVKTQLTLLGSNPLAVGCSAVAVVCDRFGTRVGEIRSEPDSWSFLDWVVGTRGIYTHASTILWRNIFRAGGGFLPRSYISRFPRGEWPLTLAFLAESRGVMLRLDKEVSIYNITGMGAWSGLSLEERNEKNAATNAAISRNIPLRFKIGYTLNRVGLRLLARKLSVRESETPDF